MSGTPTSPAATLATRCSACNTAFRVVQDQLKVSEGWVRCGRCGEVFNALDRIFDLEQARRQAASPDDAQAQAATAAEPGDPAPDPQAPVAADAAPGASPATPPAAEPTPQPTPEPAPAPAPAPWPDLSNLPVDDNTDLRLIDPEFAKAQQDAQAAGFASALIETEGSGPEPLPPWTLPPAPAKKSRRSGSRRSTAAKPTSPPPPPSTLDFVLPDLDGHDDDGQTDISLDALHDQAQLPAQGAPSARAPAADAPPLAAPATAPADAEAALPPPAGAARSPASTRPSRDKKAQDTDEDDDLPVLEDGISRFPRWVFPDESEVTGDSSLSQMGQTDGPSSLGAEDGHDTPEFVRDAERQARWRSPRMRWVMGAAAAGLSGLFLLQVGLIWRDSLAADHPALRSSLDSACATLGCRVSPPRRIEEIVVESSGLSKAAGARSSDEVYKLSFVLRNRSGVSLRLPAIELTLTDANGGIVSRKVLAGADLHAGPDAAMEPGGEVPLYALLSTPGHTVAGYTIEVFYP